MIFEAPAPELAVIHSLAYIFTKTHKSTLDLGNKRNFGHFSAKEGLKMVKIDNFFEKLPIFSSKKGGRAEIVP